MSRTTPTYTEYLYEHGYNNPYPSGIYALVNVRSDKLYIGSSVDLTRRASQHFRSLEEGIHHNRVLQYSWDVDGPSSFSFIVLEYVPNRERLEEREQAWLNRFEKVRLFNIQQRVSRQDTWEDWRPVDDVTLPWEDEALDKVDAERGKT